MGFYELKRRARLTLTFFLVAITFIASSCVFRAAAFRRASFLLQLKIDSIFKLSSLQRATLRRELDVFLTDLNRREVLAVQELLIDSSKQLKQGATMDEVESFFVRWDTLYSGALTRASAPIGAFLADLNPEQVSQFKDVQLERRREISESLSVGEVEFASRSRKKTAKQVSVWIGTLNEKQLAAVSGFAQQEFGWRKREVVARERSHEKFTNALQERQSAQKLAELFLQQQTLPFSQLDPEHAALRRERRAQWAKLISDLSLSITNEQRAHFKRETQSLAADVALIGASSD